MRSSRSVASARERPSPLVLLGRYRFIEGLFTFQMDCDTPIMTPRMMNRLLVRVLALPLAQELASGVDAAASAGGVGCLGILHFCSRVLLLFSWFLVRVCSVRISTLFVIFYVS